MAIIYDKAITALPLIDKTLILDPREGFLQPFNVGTNWTELRAGFLVSMVPAVGDNAVQVPETATGGTPVEKYFFGIKDSSLILPGVAGSAFFGQSHNSSVILSAAHALAVSKLMVITKDATQTISGASSSAYVGPQDPTGPALYANFIGVKIVVANVGTSTQSITASGINASTIYSDPSEASLRTMLLTATAGGSAGAVWHDSGVPRPLPDHLFAYLPFINNRLRVHAAVAERYA